MYNARPLLRGPIEHIEVYGKVGQRINSDSRRDYDRWSEWHRKHCTQLRTFVWNLLFLMELANFSYRINCIWVVRVYIGMIVWFISHRRMKKVSLICQRISIVFISLVFPLLNMMMNIDLVCCSSRAIQKSLSSHRVYIWIASLISFRITHHRCTHSGKPKLKYICHVSRAKIRNPIDRLSIANSFFFYHTHSYSSV